MKSEIFEEYKRFGKSIVLEVYRFEDAQKSRRKRWAEASSRLDIKAVKVEKFWSNFGFSIAFSQSKAFIAEAKSADFIRPNLSLDSVSGSWRTLAQFIFFWFVYGLDFRWLGR